MMFRLLLAALLLVHSGLRAEPAAEKAGFAPRLIIYNAKGPANSCGPGCDRWIAIEGQVDEGAAARVVRFLRDVKDTKRPIYFHSPGGSVRPSYVIARLLRSRKAVARIGRTIATGCAGGTQVDAACLKIKMAGGEVEAELTTRNAMCNSACGYLFFGATTREVAPDAVIAVHNSRLKLFVRGPISAQQIADFKQRGMERADRERAAFVVSMGISRELDDLIKTVKFESMHILTRAELYRFGIDRRPQPETAWTLEAAARPYVRKVAAARQGDGASFRTMEWRLFCENKDRARLTFVRESDQSGGGLKKMMLMAGSDKSVAFGRYPARIGKFEVWSDVVAPDAMQAILTASHLQMGEGTLSAGGKTTLATFDIDTLGLGASWTQLLASCPANTARPAAASSSLNINAAPAIPATSAAPASPPK
ncbi:hypothetical protein IVB30_14040 [Bradyrhizobium sp. 200]|uniref:COG3904 family protein n=1 Tax=Bradyrhizobium sp. 200 TaxID=2782665 RepID=UPI001FFE5CCC|nr:hypothetical protein [Bradyrhizobium sp. 200]UPJ52372.1 hypothetical protein IVB30_14040 [Bradyrhizobium sp. 200]